MTEILSVEDALRTFDQGDSFLVYHRVESIEDPVAAARVYSELVGELFKRRNIPRMIMVGHAAVRYCERQARTLDKDNSAASTKLKEAAKVIAFNVGANTWPGWGEEGLQLTTSDLSFGLDSARVSLRLAEELGGDPNVLGNGHWLVGAHLLSIGDADGATREFALSANFFQTAGNSTAELMAKGYEAIAGGLDPVVRESSREHLRMVLDALSKDESKDAPFFVEQIKTAAKIVLGPAG